MREIRDWISAAQRDLRIGVVEMSRDSATEVASKAKDRFVSGDPTSWWMALRGEYQRVNSKLFSLSMLFPNPATNAYLIPNTEEEELPVYEGSIEDFEKVLNDCPFFEYCVVATDNSWAVVESDHNEYFLCGTIRVPVE
jgi:hypothetical protein